MSDVMLLGRYELQDELGHGATGSVHRGYDRLLDRQVAVKRISSPVISPDLQTRLLAEARAAARLNHPNIISIFDAGEVDGQAFIVMELLEGPSLYERPPRGLREIIDYAGQICAALEQAHRHGIVHRDLKPENIMHSGGGLVKLTDFGLARSLSSRLSLDSRIVGTVFYLSPEQALGKDLDGRTDLYALGVLLYEWSAGRLPFTGDDPLAVISQHLHAPPTPPSAHNAHIPAALEDLILALLAKRPEDRPPTAQAVRQALEALDDPTAAPISPRPVSPLERLGRSRLVGRDQELAQARQLWSQALARQLTTPALLVSGEQGAGKTPFVSEVATLVEVSGGWVLGGQSYPEGGLPYDALAQIIQTALRAAPPPGLSNMTLADLVTLAPELSAQFPGLPPNPPLDPAAEQRRIFDNAAAAFAALSAGRPLLLVIEDVQWADSGTLHLLRHLARRIRTARLPILLLLTYRENELAAAPTLQLLHGDLSRERLSVELHLPRLDRRLTGRVLEAMFNQPADDELLERIFCETEGNLRYIEEIVKSLIADERIRPDENGRWRMVELDKIELPQSIRAAVQSQIGRLPEPSQEALRLAAIFGREFEFAALARLSNQTEDSLIAALELAERAQLIQPIDGGEESFAFAHGWIPVTLEESMSSLRRHRLHRLAAAALAELHPEQDAVLAYHYAQAGDSALARSHYIRAGDQSAAVYAQRDAIRYYSQALALTPAGAPERFDLLAKRLRAYDITAQREPQRADAEEMLALAEAHNDPAHADVAHADVAHADVAHADVAHADVAHADAALAGQAQGNPAQICDALLALGDLYLETDLFQARPTLERAVELARSLGDPLREGQALRRLGYQARLRSGSQAARQMLTQAVECFRAAGSPREEAASLNILALALSDDGQHDEALSAAAQALTLARQSGDRLQEATSLRRLAIVHMNMRQFAQARPHAQASLELHRRLGDRSEEVNGLNVLGMLNFALNEPEAGEQHLRQSLALALQIGNTSSASNAIHNLLNLRYRRAQEFEAGLAFLDEQAALLSGSEDALLWSLLLRQGYVNLHIDTGQYEAALREARSLQPEVGRMWSSNILLQFVIVEGYLLAYMGRYAEAWQVYARAKELAGQEEDAPFEMALLGSLFASIVEMQGDAPQYEQALAEIRQAIAEMRKKGAHEEISDGLALAARLLLKLGRPAEALAAIDEALAVEVDMPRLLNELHWVHAQALRASGDAASAAAVLARARQNVLAAAARFRDPALRQSWLENVPAHRSILAEEA